MHLKGISYQYDTDAMPSSKGDERVYLGFIAQEVERTLPQVVATKNIPVGETSNKLNSQNNPIYKTLKVVDYVQVVPVLVEAIKEQQKLIEDLQKQQVETGSIKENEQKQQQKIDELQKQMDELRLLLKEKK
jgi:hypothetical protein